MKRKCTAKTKAGRPCRAWAVHETEPPLCPAHAGFTQGSAPGRPYAPDRNFYRRELTQQEVADLAAYASDATLSDEIAASRAMLRRLLSLSQRYDDLTVRELTRIAALVFNGSRAVAQLLRDERALSGEAADGIAGAIGQALDELATEWRLEL